MNAVDLAANAVQMLLNSASTGVGAGVSELVRARLVESEQGRQALHGVEHQEAGSVSAVQDLVAQAVRTDPEFAARLENAWGEANAQQTAGRDASHVTVQGGSLQGRNLSLGPLTINSSGNARLAIVALTLVAVAGVALAAYGGQQLIVEVISPQAGATATITASVTPEEAQEPDPGDDSSDTPEPETMPPVAEPTSEARVEISADPDAAATGDTITITGTGFLPNEQVRISCEDSGFQGPIDLRDTSANDEGAISVEVIIPPNDYMEAGESFYVRAWGTTSDTRAETLVYLTAGS